MFRLIRSVADASFDWLPMKMTMETPLTSNILWPADDYVADKALCIEFVNTISWRGKTNPSEHLSSVQSWFEWLEQNQAVPEGSLKALSEKGKADPEEAEAAFEKAIKLREAIYNLLSGYWQHREPSAKDRMLLQEVLARAMARLRFIPHHGHWSFELEVTPTWDAALYAPALSCAQLLTSHFAEKVKSCGRDECQWLFLDLTKNHSRKWCDMTSCGNVEKARASYARKKGLA